MDHQGKTHPQRPAFELGEDRNKAQVLNDLDELSSARLSSWARIATQYQRGKYISGTWQRPAFELGEDRNFNSGEQFHHTLMQRPAFELGEDRNRWRPDEG